MTGQPSLAIIMGDQALADIIQSHLITLAMNQVLTIGILHRQYQLPVSELADYLYLTAVYFRLNPMKYGIFQ